MLGITDWRDSRGGGLLTRGGIEALLKLAIVALEPGGFATMPEHGRQGDQPAQHRTHDDHDQHDDNKRHARDSVVGEKSDHDGIGILECKEQNDNKGEQPQYPGQIAHKQDPMNSAWVNCSEKMKTGSRSWWSPLQKNAG